ncbi:unnamed protein product [Ilex paraguariensis]|uniref:Uncharacterized protein n=1 Tax=Ilex paraguariensis TaxID=185542 RepID=A0ABC8TPA8_9AQUA
MSMLGTSLVVVYPLVAQTKLVPPNAQISSSFSWESLIIPSSGRHSVPTEAEGDRDPTKDSNSITKLVRRQTAVKKRKATTEPSADKARGDLEALDEGSCLAKVTILPPDLWIFEDLDDNSMAHSSIHLMVVGLQRVLDLGARAINRGKEVKKTLLSKSLAVEKCGNKELDQKLKVAEQSKKAACDVATLVKELNSSIQALFKEVEDKAYDEGFEKDEKVMKEQVPVIEGFFFKKVWDAALVETKVPTDSKFFSKHVVTILSSFGASLPPADPLVEPSMMNVAIVDSPITGLIDSSVVNLVDILLLFLTLLQVLTKKLSYLFSQL